MPSAIYLSRGQAREFDHRASTEFEVPAIVLMENAGRGCAELLMRLNPAKQPVVILCGPGDNGGDGFVIARHLDNHGWPVQVIAFSQPERERSSQAAVNFSIMLESGIPFEELATPGLDLNTCAALAPERLAKAGWIVDALFGTGLSRPLVAPFDALVARMTTAGVPVLAIDLPSGLDCDTGEPLGSCVMATHTATFVGPKLGFRNATAAKWTGTVHTIDIGAPRALVDDYRE